MEDRLIGFSHNGNRYDFLNKGNMYHEIQYICKLDDGFLIKHTGLPNVFEQDRFVEYNNDGSTKNPNDTWFAAEIVKPKVSVLKIVTYVSKESDDIYVESMEEIDIDKSFLDKFTTPDFIKEE